MREETYPASQILYEALNVGEQMLICGAEVYRVEDTISRICYAYDMKRVDVFTITSSIVVTIQTKEDEIVTQTRRIAGYETNLNRLSRLNALSREICAKRIRPDEIEEKIQYILAEPIYSVWMQYLCYCMVSAMFTLFFGGSLSDGIASMLTGFLLCMLVRGSRQRIANRLLFALCEAVFTGFAAVAIVRLGIGENISKIVIGNIMLLIPGIPMTNSIRDMLGGDTMSGILRLCESLLLAIAIAGGMALVLFWYSPAAEAHAMVSAFENWYFSPQGQIVIQMITAFFGSLGFAILFQIRGKHMWFGAFGGMMTWGVYLLTGMFTDSVFWGFTIASAAATCYGEWMARREKTPATLFLVPSVVPLIPGGSLYDTMYFAVNNEYANFADKGIRTLSMAAAISIGILLASSIIRKVTQTLAGQP